ncbi:Hint domain-containing protein [Gymnodinialimonas ulvae]|uniref:Hint domain-containing protein n=1 Tax=Gymnodinialimonas ulvae TaxID=3126504 RepID=UPI0030A292C1
MINAAHNTPQKAYPTPADAVALRATHQGTRCPIASARLDMADATGSPFGQMVGGLSECGAGLAPGTQVLTLDGALPVEFLTPGDRIITRRGARAVQAVTRHLLPAGSTRIRISASALGGHPSNDIIIMPDQRVLVRDWRAQALWGTDCAAIPAARLVDGTFIRTETGAEQIMLSLYFGAPEILYADGLELASADKPMVAASAH